MKNILLPTFLAFSSSFLISCGFDLPEPHSLEYDSKSFDSLATFILRQDKIFEMDDFSRHFKSINYIPIKLSKSKDDQSAQFLNIVEDSLELEPKIVNHLRIQLEKTKLREFERSGDSILFTVDGFLDNAWGFMYCGKPAKMDSSWFDFKGQSIKYVEDINPNWKKVAIR